MAEAHASTWPFRRIWDSLHRTDMSLRAQLFTAAALTGVAVSLAATIYNAAVGLWLHSVACFVAAGIGALLLYFAIHTGRFRTASIITVIVVFIGLFTTLFFLGGGHRSGMPAFFVFGIAFTALLLDGVALGVLVTAELAIYVTACVISFVLPEWVRRLPSGRDEVIDVIFCLIIAGVAMAFVLHQLMRIYERNRQQLAERNNQLRLVDRDKSRFLAVVAHELNTPLSAVSAHAERALRRGDTGQDIDVNEALHIIAAESGRLSILVTQLLDFSRLEESRLWLNRQPVYLSEVVQETLRVYQVLSNANNNTVKVTGGGMDQQLSIDRHRISQVLINILSNADRYTRNGTITVSLREEADTTQIVISDNGEGIPEQFLGHLFDRSIRWHDADVRSNRDTGLGIGLSVCKDIMNLHGGDIDVTSQLGEGTTVRLTFPNCVTQTVS